MKVAQKKIKISSQKCMDHKHKYHRWHKQCPKENKTWNKMKMLNQSFMMLMNK